MMTKEQHRNAATWARFMDGDEYEQVKLPGRDANEIASLLRAGIAASEEGERLREQLAEAEACAIGEAIRTDNRETLRNALAENERLRRALLEDAAWCNEAWLAAWDAEWRAQEADKAFFRVGRRLMEVQR